MNTADSDPGARVPRHSLADGDHWHECEATASYSLAELQTHPRIDLLQRMQSELALGLLRRFLDREPERANAHLAMAMDCGAALALARVAARRGDGFLVELRWPEPDGSERFIGLPARHNDFGWPQWLDACSLALLAGDAQVPGVLATAECVDACTPPEQADGFWPLLCAALAALWRRDRNTSDLLAEAEGRMDRAWVMDPDRVDALFRPLIPLLRAVHAGDAEAVAEAAVAALVAHRDWYAADPDGAGDPDGLYSLPIGALLAEAGRRGLGPLPVSDYLPSPFERPEPAAELVLVYPRLAILDALEAAWLMQNEGFVRHDRSVVSQAQDGRLVARYRAHDAPGIPMGELEFELLDARRDGIYDGSHATPALDVGELIQRAQWLASHPATDEGGEAVYDLIQAVEALDLALAYLAAMPGGFDPASLHSEAGRRLWRSEPGRFDPARLLVYRNSLARQAGLDEWKSLEVAPEPDQESAVTPAPPPCNEDEAREQVTTLLEELKPLVLPVLESIALDQDGSAVRALLPRDGDYALAFNAELAEAAAAHYAEWWAEQFKGGLPGALEPGSRIELHLSPAGMLGSENPLSRPFPNGYRQIAQWLDPRRIWVCWKFIPPGESSGIAMNGLVWLDDHWAWFPKPYRLAELLRKH